MPPAPSPVPPTKSPKPYGSPNRLPTAGMAPAVPTTSEIGVNFMTNYIFPFEYVSLVLLAAMIGAAIIVRESRDRNEVVESAVIPEKNSDETGEVQS